MDADAHGLVIEIVRWLSKALDTDRRSRLSPNEKVQLKPASVCGWVVWLAVFASSCAVAGPILSGVSAIIGVAQLHQSSEMMDQPAFAQQPDTSVRRNEAIMMANGFRLLEPADMSDYAQGMSHFVATDDEVARLRRYLPSLNAGEPVYIWSDRKPENCNCEMIGDHAALQATELQWLEANSATARPPAMSPPDP
jgi:hypothetical protein